LKKISSLSDDQLQTSFNSLLAKISFINEELIPQKIWEDSEKILNEVDLDDIDFVALTKSIKGKLWTGDKVLYHGLKNKGFRNVLTTADVLKIWLRRKRS
jgi:predicted nucleic acid-binding protein